MDPIIGSNSSVFSHLQAGAKKEVIVNSPPGSSTVASEEVSLISDIKNLAKAAENSDPDIRPDVVAKAEKLLNDPNWLSDSNLDALADRILSTEDL
jgi:hypothetical protein